MYISDIKQTGEAADAYANIFARTTGVDPVVLRRKLERVGKNTLRTARVRIDCVAMLAWQEYFTQVLHQFEDLDVYLFCDGSPQWRGLELYASSADV